jgi:hypothetical protein
MSSTDPNQLEQLLRQLLNPAQQYHVKPNQRGNGFPAPAPQQNTMQSFQQNAAPAANNILQQLLGLQQGQSDMRSNIASEISSIAQQSTVGNHSTQAASTDNAPEASVSTQSKEGDRNPPSGTKMIPCRARRMPMDHDFLVSSSFRLGWGHLY